MSSVKNNKSASPAGILNNVMGNNSNTGTAPGNISKNTNTSNLKKTNLQKHQNPPQPPTQKPGQVTEQNPGKNTNTQGTTNSKLLNKTKGQQQSNTTKQNQSMKQNQGPNTNVTNKQSNSNQKNLKMSTKSNISSISTTTGYTVSTNANNSSNYTRSSQDTVSHLFSTDTNITTNNFGDNSFPVTPSTAAPSSAPQSPSMSNYGSTAKRSGASPRTPQPNSPLSNNATKAREISIVSTHSEDPLSIFFSRQLDWSTKGVPEIMKNIDKRRTWTCPDMDWSATGIPKCFLPNDESNFKTLTSLRSGSDLNLNDLWKFSWNDKGLPLPKDNYLEKFIDPHKGNMVDWNRVRYWENVILDWNRKGIPEVFRKARYCTKNSGDKIDRSKGAYNEKSPCKIDWNGNGMPEIFKKINPNKWEKKAKEEKNNSSNSNFNLSSESLIMDWNCSGLPKQLRPKFWTHYDLALDWSVNGMTTIMDQLPTAKSRMMSAKESLEHSICGSLDWSEKGVPQKFGNLMNRQLFSKSGDEMMSLNWCAKGIPKCFRTAIKNDNSMEKKFNCNSNLTPCYLKVDSRSQNRIAKDNRKLKRKQAHLKNVYRFDPHNKTRQALLSVQFDHFRRQLLHPSQLPSEYNLKHKQQFIQNTVPMLKEKNRRDQSREDDVTGCDWTESGIPKGLKHEFVRNEELRFDWSDKGIPKMFNVGGKFNNNNKLDSLRDSDDMDWILIRGSNQSTKNRESNYEAAKEKQQLEEYWDNLVVDWSGVNNNKGVPLGKRQLDDYKIDWSCKGIPKLLDNAHFKCRHGSSYMKAGNSFHKDSQIIHIQSDEIMSMTSGSSKSTPKQMSPKSTPKRKSAGFQKHQDTNLWISVDAYQNHVNSKKNNNNSSSSIATSNKSNNSWVNLSSGHISNTSTSPPGSHASAESLNSENMNNNNNHSKKNKKGNHHHHHNDKHHKNLDTIQQHQKTPDSQIPKNNNNIQKVKGPATPISTVSTQDPSKARLNSKSGRSGLYTALEKRELFWAKQLDWSSTGIPQGFEVLRSQRAKEKEFASSKYNFRYREETDHNMFIDWSNCGKHKMPTQFREFAPSCWGALKGRKHFFNDDTFTIDWNMNGLPKMLYDNEKNPLCRDYQYDPMIMDWNEKGMPMEFRKINNERTSGRKAAIEYPIINWNASGIPKRYDQIANNGASRRGEWDDQIQCQWAEEGLPIVTVSGSSGKFSNSTMSKQINMNSLKGVEEYEEPCQLDFSQNGCLDPFKSSIYDNLTIDWTQSGCLDNSTIHQEGKKLRARTRFNGKTKQQNRRDLDNCNMEITYNMIDGDNTAGYNRRKNRCWNGENQQIRKPGYVWTQDNEIKPKLLTA